MIYCAAIDCRIKKNLSSAPNSSQDQLIYLQLVNGCVYNLRQYLQNTTLQQFEIKTG
jgi:hypothetical protein